MTTNDSRYGGTAIALHWTGALLIVAGAGLGLTMVGLPLTPDKLRLYAWHKWIGITVFLLALARLALRWRVGAPPYPPTMAAWQVRAAQSVQALLYALMLAVPVSGWLYSSSTGVSVSYLGVVPLPNLVPKDKALASALLLLHQALNALLGAAVCLHVAAALKHRFVDRDQVLSRMLPR